MKRNTILATAVVLALGSGGMAMAQDAQECASEALRLTLEVDQSTMTDAAKADLSKSLTEAQGADVARCEQIVSRVQREMTSPDTPKDSDLSSATDAASQPSKSAVSSMSGSDAGYEEGHASADASLPQHPGAVDNDSSTAAVSETGDVQQGYASPQETMKGNETAAGAATVTNALASMSTKDLVDKPVKSLGGDEVGEIDAIVTDKSSDAHGYAVIGFGGVFGLGEKQVLLDLAQLQVSADGSIRVPATDEKDFDSFPKYVEQDYEEYDGAIARVL